MKSKRILAIIPARANSKRLKNKNILPIAGKEMYLHTLEKIVDSKLVDWIVVSTDIKEILKNEAFAIKRPKETATDNSPLDDCLRWTLKFMEEVTGEKFDYICMTHCNIPLRKEGEIDKLIKIALKNPEATAVCTAYEVERPYEWIFEQKGKYFYRPMVNNKFRKQDLPRRFMIDGSIQIHKVDALMKATGKAFEYFGDKIIIVPHDKKFGEEIDTKEDYDYVEYLLKKGE